jgi:hypothetical protein
MVGKITLLKSSPDFSWGEKKWNETMVGEEYYRAVVLMPILVPECFSWNFKWNPLCMCIYR